MTIPIALFMGFYLRVLRPGRVVEATAIGVGLLLVAIVAGGIIDHSSLAEAFTLSPKTLVVCLVVYGFAASVLPVWMLLAPRDYLSTFMKIGTIGLLAVGILLTLPVLENQAVTKFAGNGQGPVFAGPLFPFVFIIIACGALSGFHALIASGTTPKLIEKESQVRMIGYGAMLTESFVAVMAMIFSGAFGGEALKAFWYHRQPLEADRPAVLATGRLRHQRGRGGRLGLLPVGRRHRPADRLLRPAGQVQQALDAGKVIPPAKSLEDVGQIVTNSTVDGVLSILFAALIIVVIVDAARVWAQVLTGRREPELAEAPAEPSRLWAPSGLFLTAEDRARQDEQRELQPVGASGDRSGGEP